MRNVIAANTPEEAKQEIIDYLESVIEAERQKPVFKARDICLVDRLKLAIQQAEIIPRKSSC